MKPSTSSGNNFMQNKNNLKVLIWDFDGTLYKPNPKLWKDVREAEYRVIMDHTGWSREKTIEQFVGLHKIVTPSATETVAKLAGISTSTAAVEMEKYYDRTRYVSRDEKLIDLFNTLHNFKHYILANGARNALENTLKALGLERILFKEIVTSEVVGVNKPHLEGFNYIIQKTKHAPEEHMMIGDREEVDLVPAKQVRMQTCLVWSEIKSSVADYTVKTVYEIEKILI